MTKKIIADISVHQIRIALLDAGRLVELFIEQKNRQTIVNNIYRGRVQSILPGMDAAFVDIGQNKNAFLKLNNKMYSGIKLKQGMEITVQVLKDATGTKGAVLNDELNIAGKFIVLIPNDGNYVAISNKIEDEEERMRLKNIVNELKPENYGVIVRTNAENKTLEEIKEEIESIYYTSKKMLEMAPYQKAPCLLYKEASVIDRVIRDFYSEEIDEFVINDEEEYKRLSKLSIDGFDKKLRFYNEKATIFDYFCLETQIDKALQKQVWLKSGGFLVIEQTEACTVIDVNTGKFVGKKNSQDTIFKTNKEAAIEIAKQLRLRNLSGIIIVDFIDMLAIEKRKELLNILTEETKKDSVKTFVVGMTELGLVQITRQKKREPISKLLLGNCPCCNGTGKIPSLARTVNLIQREVENIFRQTIFNYIDLYANEDIIANFCGENKEYLIFLEEKYNSKINCIRQNSLNNTEYKIEKKKV